MMSRPFVNTHIGCISQPILAYLYHNCLPVLAPHALGNRLFIYFFIYLFTQVLIRMQQYKGDLSVSCLRLVLSLPLEIVVLDVSSLVPAMKVRYARVMHLSMSCWGGEGGGRTWGGDLIVFVGPGVGQLTDLVLPGEGIFECLFT